MTETPVQNKFLWARLNAYGFLLVLLAIGSGVFAFLVPMSDPIFAKYHKTTAILNIQATAFILGGLMMAYAFFREKIRLEILGLFVIFGGALIQTWRALVAFGVHGGFLAESIVVDLIMVAVITLRFSAFTGKDRVISLGHGERRGE